MGPKTLPTFLTGSEVLPTRAMQESHFEYSGSSAAPDPEGNREGNIRGKKGKVVKEHV